MPYTRISISNNWSLPAVVCAALLWVALCLGCASVTSRQHIFLAVPFNNQPGAWNQCNLEMSFDGQIWGPVRTPVYVPPSPALCRNATLLKLGSTYLLSYSSFLPSGTVTGTSTSFGLASGRDPLHLSHLTEVSFESCCMGVGTATPILDEHGELHFIVHAWTGPQTGQLELWEVHDDRCAVADQTGCGSGWSSPVPLRCTTLSGCGNADGTIRALDPSMVATGGQYFLIAGGGAIVQFSPSASITGPFEPVSIVVPSNAEASTVIQTGPDTWRDTYIDTVTYRPYLIETDNLASGVWGHPLPLLVTDRHSDSWGATRFTDVDTMRSILGNSYRP